MIGALGTIENGLKIKNYEELEILPYLQAEKLACIGDKGPNGL